MIEASFTGDRIVILNSSEYLHIYDFNPDWTIAGTNVLHLRTPIPWPLTKTQREDNAEMRAIIVSLSCSKLIVKSKGIYYEYNNQIKISEHNNGKNIYLDEDFSKTNLKNIIKCGIYDILIYDKHVKIFNNINPFN